MENYNNAESNICKFNCCPYFDFENNKCILKICEVKIRQLK